MTAPHGTSDGVPARHTVPALAFAVTDARPERFAAVPTLRFELGITRTGGGPIRSIALTVSIRIDVTRRRYDDRTRHALAELFGAPDRWGTTLRPLAWTQTTVTVPPFTDATTVGLTVPCPVDTELAVTKYLHAVRDGEVPLDFLFNGTVFFQAPDGLLRTAQISWAEDAHHRLPAGMWHALIDRYFAGSPWLRLSRETYDRLDAYRVRRVFGTWDDVIGDLLDRADAPTPELSGPSRVPKTTGAPWTR
ncbi:DUF6084 family protein [Streptomyces megasporus]|uniref:DUF6084 family protein n=1 Tax=Streptomyces megasporus TaxID=44060 RepID=UPI001B80597A|nr:DUF6084 family protein [Streptomyces megasporus]